MQSLLSQITNLFATQSLNSLENSELVTYPSVSTEANTEFGGLLESFSGESQAANIAAVYGNSSQVSHIPISLQITQFALTAKHGNSGEAIEYNGQIVNAQVNGNLKSLTDVQNQNANINVNEVYNSTLTGNYTNLSAVSSQISDNKHQIQSTISADQIVNPVSLVAGFNNLANESSSKHLLVNLNQQSINIDSGGFIDNRPALRNFIDTRPQDNVDQNNRNVIVNDRITTNNINDSLLKDAVTKDSVLANNTATTVKPLEQSLTAYSVAPIDERLAKTPVSSNVKIDSKNLITGELNSTDSTAPLIKETLAHKSISTDGKLDTQTIAQDSHKLSNPVLNTLAEHVSTDDLPIDKLEIVAAKQAYNPLQQDEINRTENNVRDEKVNMRSNILDQNYLSDSANRTISRNEVSIDLTSVSKSQDITQDVKFTSNNIAIDKTILHATVTPEQLSVSNKTSGLEKSPLQLDSSNKVSNGTDLAQQIAWAKNNNTNNIKIAIAPEHLGALEINIESDADGLNIQFITQNSTAKDALETFMPRLKDMLEQNGLNLQNANVSQQDKGQNDNAEYDDSEQFISQSNNNEQLDAENSSESVIKSEQANNRLLEAFA